MVKKKEPVNMNLEYYEKSSLLELSESRQALVELQTAVIPFAKNVAKEQRVWWDRVLEARGLTRDGHEYSTDGIKIIDENQDAIK